MLDRIEAIQKALEENFLRIDEMTQLVLKGHLLIEESVNKALLSAFPHPQYVENLNLRFHQKTKLLRAVSVKFHDDSIWMLISAINDLRNEIAHSLDSPKRVDKILEVRNHFFIAAADFPKVEELRSSTDENIVALSVALALGAMLGLETHAEQISLFSKVLAGLAS